jgi:hypothetical protein
MYRLRARRHFLLGFSVVLGAVWLYGPTQTVRGQDGFTVRGRVSYSDGLPATSMEVWLSVDCYSRTIGPALSDHDGRFRFENVPAGRYFLLASSLAQGDYIWNETPLTEGTRRGSMVMVGPEIPGVDVVFRIERHAKVYGVVTDPYGDPLPGVMIFALRRMWAFGRPYLANATSTGRSDDEGAFRLWSLPKGRYRVCALQITGEIPLGTADFKASGPTGIHVADCPSDGPFTEILPGEERRVDLKGRAVPAAPVRMSGIEYKDGESRSVEFLPIYPPDETRSLFFASHLVVTRSNDGGRGSLTVPPGRYWLTAASSTHALAERIAVTVALDRPNIFDLQIGAAPAANLDVTFPPGNENAQPQVGFHDADDPGAAVVYPSTQATQGTQTHPAKITLPYPGRYWLAVRSEMCASAAWAGDVDLLKQPLTFKTGQAIVVHVRFEKPCASIHGRITAGGVAVPRARLAILVSGSPKNPGDVFVDPTDDDGKYIITGLAAGDYRLWAWKQEDEESGRIGSLGEIARQGHRVRLKRGETKDVDLRVMKIKGRSGK